jgi:ATP-dependent Clp protease adaptor protein ClpS
MLLRFHSSDGSVMTRIPAISAPIQAARAAAWPITGGPDADDGGSGDDNTRRDSGIAVKTRPRVKRPSLYRVLLLNDDYTPMEFVVLVLQEVFNKSREEAWRITQHVHQRGVGECGVYPYEVAETKVARVMDTARKNQHPLQCVMEKQ